MNFVSQFEFQIFRVSPKNLPIIKERPPIEVDSLSHLLGLPINPTQSANPQVHIAKIPLRSYNVVTQKRAADSCRSLQEEPYEQKA